MLRFEEVSDESLLSELRQCFLSVQRDPQTGAIHKRRDEINHEDSDTLLAIGAVHVEVEGSALGVEDEDDVSLLLQARGLSGIMLWTWLSIRRRNDGSMIVFFTKIPCVCIVLDGDSQSADVFCPDSKQTHLLQQKCKPFLKCGSGRSRSLM